MKIAGILQEHHLHQSGYAQLRKKEREGEGKGEGRGGRILFSWLILISLYSKHASVKTAACSKYRILQLIQKSIYISETSTTM